MINHIQVWRQSELVVPAVADGVRYEIHAFLPLSGRKCGAERCSFRARSASAANPTRGVVVPLQSRRGPDGSAFADRGLGAF